MPPIVALDQYSDEYLLELYKSGALPNGVSAEEIKRELASRGHLVNETSGTEPGFVQNYSLPDTKLRRGVKGFFVWTIALFGAAFATQLLTGSAFGSLVSAALVFSLWLYGRKDRAHDSEVQHAVRQAEIRQTLNPLMIAAAEGDLEQVRELIRAGADPNAFGSDRTTALMFAARNNRIEVVQELLAAGADPGFSGKDGITAVSISERFGHEDVAKLIRRHVEA